MVGCMGTYTYLKSVTCLWVEKMESTYYTLALGRVTLDVSPWQDGDPDSQRGAPGFRVEAGNVGKVQGAAVANCLPTPGSVEAADVVARLRGFRDSGRVLARETNWATRAI